MTHKSTTAVGGSAKGGALRDLLSSVAQQVESHLHPHTATSPSGQGRVGRRPNRIRSWIVHGDKDPKVDDKNKENNGDNSLHFTDAESDDDFARETSGGGPSKVTHPSHDHRSSEHRIHHHTEDPKMHMLPEEIKEEESVGMLTSLMGDGVDREVVRRILRKYNGNVERAAMALVEGERGEETVGSGALSGPGPQQAPAGHYQIQSQGWPTVTGPSASSSSWSIATGSGSAQTGMLTSQTPQTRLGLSDAPGGRPNTPVIDLTLDDDPDLQRAMQESMDTLHASASGSLSSSSQAYSPSYATQTGYQTLSQLYTPSQRDDQTQGMVAQSQPQPDRPVFGPSERPSDPNWALVPSHQNENSDANYLQNLNRAIEASLETVGDSDALEPFPVERQLRRDECPVALRPSMHTMVYATSILQGLFYVPQVRARTARWRPYIPTNEGEVTPPTNDSDCAMLALSEIFTHMDLARLCDLNVDKRLPEFSIEPWDKLAQPPGELSRKFFARLSATLEKAFIDQLARNGRSLPKPRLLHFQYGSGTSEPGELLQETSIVPIDVNGGESNDLIGRLSAQLSKPHSEPDKQSAIFDLSEVVAFELVRSSSNPSTTTNAGGPNRKTFTYPKSIYLDQFLRENVELAQEKRKQRQEMLEEVQRLMLHKTALAHFDGKDTLKGLQSAIFYFENVADAKDDLERSNSIQTTTRKLKSILAAVEEGIKATDEKMDLLRARAETLLDCEELQRFKYDLRVAFVHDGLYGRKHLYSYVHYKSCWWKIANSLIEKVPEDLVLNDQAGLHLGAGPYLLLYSRAMEEDGSDLPLPWMDDIKDDVRIANRQFLSQLPPALVGDIVIDEDMGVSSVVKNGGAAEKMDVSP